MQFQNLTINKFRFQSVHQSLYNYYYLRISHAIHLQLERLMPTIHIGNESFALIDLGLQNQFLIFISESFALFLGRFQLGFQFGHSGSDGFRDGGGRGRGGDGLVHRWHGVQG